MPSVKKGSRELVSFCITLIKLERCTRGPKRCPTSIGTWKWGEGGCPDRRRKQKKKKKPSGRRRRRRQRGGGGTWMHANTRRDIGAYSIVWHPPPLARLWNLPAAAAASSASPMVLSMFCMSFLGVCFFVIFPSSLTFFLRLTSSEAWCSVIDGVDFDFGIFFNTWKTDEWWCDLLLMYVGNLDLDACRKGCWEGIFIHSANFPGDVYLYVPCFAYGCQRVWETWMRESFVCFFVCGVSRNGLRMIILSACITKQFTLMDSAGREFDVWYRRTQHQVWLSATSANWSSWSLRGRRLTGTSSSKLTRKRSR